MVVICEECGKIYKLDAEKLKKSMKGKTSKIKCKVCDHVIEVGLPDDDAGDTIQGNVQQVSFGDSGSEQQVVEDSFTSDESEIEVDDKGDVEDPELDSVPPPKKISPKKKP